MPLYLLHLGDLLGAARAVHDRSGRADASG
jgi:hypothetical protein